MRACPPACSAAIRQNSSSWTVLPRPKDSNSARRPPRSAHSTASRWWGFSAGESSAGSAVKPDTGARSILLFKNSM